MNPDTEALRRLTELRLQMIRNKLEREREERSDRIESDFLEDYETERQNFANDDSSEPRTSALEILLQAKLERLRALEEHNRMIRAQLAERGKDVQLRTIEIGLTLSQPSNFSRRKSRI